MNLREQLFNDVYEQCYQEPVEVNEWLADIIDSVVTDIEASDVSVEILLAGKENAGFMQMLKTCGWNINPLAMKVGRVKEIPFNLINYLLIRTGQLRQQEIV